MSGTGIWCGSWCGCPVMRCAAGLSGNICGVCGYLPRPSFHYRGLLLRLCHDCHCEERDPSSVIARLTKSAEAISGAGLCEERLLRFAHNDKLYARNDRGGNNLFLGVVIDPDVGFDETVDAGLVEIVEGVDPRPGREGDPGVHVGVGRNDQVHVSFLFVRSLLVFEKDTLKLFDQVRASLRAVVLDEHAAVLQVVDLVFLGNGLVVEAPWGDARHVRPRRRRVTVVRGMRGAQPLKVDVPEIRNLFAGQDARLGGSRPCQPCHGENGEEETAHGATATEILPSSTFTG